MYIPPIGEPQQQEVQPPVEAPQKQIKLQISNPSPGSTVIGKRVKLIIGVLALLSFGSCAICLTTGKSNKTVEPITYPTGTTESNIESIIRKELGSCNREGIQKISSLEITPTGTNYNLSVTFALDDNLNDQMIKGYAMQQVLDVLKALYTSPYKDSISTVELVGTFSMRNSYGKVTEDIVLRCELDNSTAAKVYWDNIFEKDLFKILDYVWWHPYFQKITES